MSFILFWIFVTIGGFLLNSINASTLTPDIILAESFGVSPVLTGFIEHKRISRGIYAVHSNLTISRDIGNECTVDTALYRSPMGNNQYQKLPIGSALGTLNLEDFMNKVYHKFAMVELAKCTNLPQFEDAFIPPFKAGNYYADDCIFADEAVPTFLQPGTYKLEVLFTLGEDVYGIRIIIKISVKYE